MLTEIKDPEKLKKIAAEAVLKYSDQIEVNRQLQAERDQLRRRNAELGESLDKFMRDNSELTVKLHQLEDELDRLKSGLSSATESYITGLQDEVEQLRNAATDVVRKKWDISLLSSDQCEALDGLEAALRREVDSDKS